MKLNQEKVKKAIEKRLIKNNVDLLCLPLNSSRLDFSSDFIFLG